MTTHTYINADGQRVTMILPSGAKAPRSLDVVLTPSEFVRSDIRAKELVGA